MSRTTDLAARLHRMCCQSQWWSEDCSRPDGGRHAHKVWRPKARAVLAADDPAFALHTIVCDAALDLFHTCPDPDGHAALIAKQFGLPRKAS